MATKKDNERVREWVRHNPERSKAIKARYRQANREKLRISGRRYAKLRRQNKPLYNSIQRNLYWSNLNYRIGKCIRAVMSRAFRRLAEGRKIGSTMTLLGCDIETLREHIQSRFQPGMAWNNYGYKGWHIDHIRPISSFDLCDPGQQKEAFSYKNLQPLWANDNFSKNAKWIG